MNLLAEFTFNHWFEELFDWQNELLSVQRWGLSLKNFYPLKTLNFKDKDTEIVTLNLTTFDLKYRFTPGLWERDETWGLIFGYEKILLGKSTAPLIGSGLFWARSMPKIFDRLINYLPFMEYPMGLDINPLLLLILSYGKKPQANSRSKLCFCSHSPPLPEHLEQLTNHSSHPTKYL